MRQRRNTEQKALVLYELMQADHPTATALYERISRKYASISRATVFRVLSDYADLGQIRRIELLGSDTRYDGDLRPHAHCHCVSCGKIRDVFDGALDGVLSRCEVDGFKVNSVELEYSGLCSECAARAEEIEAKDS